ncbi:E3 ubiquitin-protein ligase rnf213-alpha-like, partial [Saccoglossus kowalevskii]
MDVDVSDKPVLLDTRALLKCCIQSAAVMLEDEECRKHRSTGRIDILLELFKREGSKPNQLNFVEILKERICQLLKEKDQRSHDPTQWLCKQALTGESVQTSGTFRRAIWQSLVSTVTPLLAQVIGFADRNDNLDLILKSPSGSWIHQLWLQILRNQKLLEMTYESFLSPVKNTPREIVPVLASGVNGSFFTAHCPFSWVIKQFVEEKWEEAQNMKASTGQQNIDTTFAELLLEAELGQTVLSNLSNSDFSEFMHSYLHDFVRMIYKASSDHEYEVVCRAIHIGSFEYHQAESLEEFFFAVPEVHMSYHRIRGRLDSFFQIARLLPVDILERIPAEQEMQVLDALALIALMESLEPKKDELNDNANRERWLRRVKDAGPVVERVLDAEIQCTIFYGEISRTRIQQCRPLWVRLCVLKLFVEHVCPPKTKVGDENIKHCNRLMKALGEGVNLKSVQSVTTIENFLRKCNETASKVHFKYGVQDCGICLEAINEPVALPCDHVFCLKCLKELFRVTDTRACPTCRKEVSKHFRLEKDCIDPNPIVRSFLLQLLLLQILFNRQVYVHLQEYFDTAQHLVKSKAETIELCLLCIQCIEDSYHNQSVQFCPNATLAILRGATTKIGDSIQQSRHDKSSIGVTQLQSVAGVRFGLVTAAEVIYKFFGGSRQRNQQEIDANQTQFMLAKKLLDITAKFFTSCGSKWPRVFLVKQICRRYGIDCLQGLLKNPSLRWIAPPEAQQQVEVIPDRFVTCGKVYQDLREAMATALLDGQFKKVKDILQRCTEKREYKEALLMLAIYREFTMSYANTRMPVDDQVSQNLITFIEKSNAVQKERLAKDLVFNRQGGKCTQLKVVANQHPLHRTLAAIVVHAMSVLQCSGQNNVTDPLVALMNNPQSMN